jgi:hypothetical protein
MNENQESPNQTQQAEGRRDQQLVILSRSVEVNFPDDVRKIKKSMNEQGFDASDQDIQWAWERYSDECWAAGWVCIVRYEEAAKRVIQYLQENASVKASTTKDDE